MSIAKLLMLVGAALLLLGLILSTAPKWFGWFGRLPGDIRTEGANGSIFIPITSMIIVSVVVSIVLNLFFRR